LRWCQTRSVQAESSRQSGIASKPGMWGENPHLVKHIKTHFKSIIRKNICLLQRLLILIKKGKEYG
jgi:hypothetical protein